MLDRQKDNWMVSKLELKHTHPCSAKQAVHYTEYKELTMHAKCVIQNNDEAGIRPNKTYLALTNEDINPNFFYAVDVDEVNQFKSALWVDTRCRASYEYYGDVVSFDTTYRRNKHGLPFASFVGVNHHGKSTLLRCTLMGNEEVDLYDERRMWVPIYFQGKFWVGMRSTQRSESMHAFYGGYLHFKSGLIQFVHEYDNVLGNKEQKELEDDAADAKGVVPCSSSTTIERQFQREYTTSKFREEQQEGNLFYLIVKEQYILYREPRSWNNIVEFDPLTHKIRCECNMFASRGILCCHCLDVYFYYGVDRVPSCYVLPRWSKNVQRKHTFIKSSHDEKRSDESHNLFRRLCTHFFNVAQEFITCEEEAAMLNSGLDELRAKLVDYRVNLGSRSVPNTDNNMVTQSDTACVASDIQSPSKVATKGRPRLKKLGSELDTSIKRYMRRKKNNPPQVCVYQYIVSNHMFACLNG
ncbi:hypothetical protein Ahy_B04g073070 isoform G [Arachis hypogaea]|uniref:Protein FAR1-RELATED SEQUENCE n=1 Tax=Arachis hypogaea TaxID=3818 RepID=A0A444ZPL5_ARAHY|nr:hypothetical protein Ahy_B04g073070 isoform G [Arachis hypogaea]